MLLPADRRSPVHVSSDRRRSVPLSVAVRDELEELDFPFQDA